MSDPDFDWNDVDVVIPNQQPIAVYTNPDGDVVIRQDGDWWRRDDAWVVVLPENVRQLVAAMLALVEPEKPRALPAPMTSAERAKRYRENKRHDNVTRNVTGRDDLFANGEVPASD